MNFNASVYPVTLEDVTGWVAGGYLRYWNDKGRPLLLVAPSVVSGEQRGAMSLQLVLNIRGLRPQGQPCRA